MRGGEEETGERRERRGRSRGGGGGGFIKELHQKRTKAASLERGLVCDCDWRLK